MSLDSFHADVNVGEVGVQQLTHIRDYGQLEEQPDVRDKAGIPIRTRNWCQS